MANDVSKDDLNVFKQALYIDNDLDDQMIADYLKNAKEYVQNAVSPTADLSSYSQYKYAVQMLAQFWYQNRAVDMNKTPYQVVSMIQQLRGLV